MTNTLTRSYAYVKLTAPTTGIVVDDYIVGQTSGAVGIVAEVTDGTHLQVYEMSATAFAPTENIKTAVTNITASCTARAAGDSSYLPADAALVIGTNGANETNIFRMIANISGIGGVSNPSSSQAYLGLEMIIWIGRRGQGADTVAITQDENVYLGNNTHKSCLRIVGDASNSSLLKAGYAKYKDNDTTIFPPLYAQNGSVIKINSLGSSAFEGLMIDTYGKLWSSGSTLQGDNTNSGTMFDAYGQTRFFKTLFLEWGSYSTFSGLWSIDTCYAQSAQYAIFFTTTSPTYLNKLYVQNNNADFLYFFGASFELNFFNFFHYDDNAGYSTHWNFVDGGATDVIIHFINSDIDNSKSSTYFGGDTESLKENSFKLTVTDEQGNPIQGASVDLKDQYGKALYQKLTATMNGNLTATFTAITTISTAEIAVGDVLQFGCNRVIVTGINSSTSYNVTGGYEGTTKHRLRFATAKLYKAVQATTDGNGQINFDSTGVYKAVATNMDYQMATNVNVPWTSGTFTLTVSKSGYKTYKSKLTISGSTGLDLKIALKATKDLVDDNGYYYIANNETIDLLKDDGKSLMSL